MILVGSNKTIQGILLHPLFWEAVNVMKVFWVELLPKAPAKGQPVAGAPPSRVGEWVGEQKTA